MRTRRIRPSRFGEWIDRFSRSTAFIVTGWLLSLYVLGDDFIRLLVGLSNGSISHADQEWYQQVGLHGATFGSLAWHWVRALALWAYANSYFSASSMLTFAWFGFHARAVYREGKSLAFRATRRVGRILRCKSVMAKDDEEPAKPTPSLPRIEATFPSAVNLTDVDCEGEGVGC